jgi:hypothetical protein
MRSPTVFTIFSFLTKQEYREQAKKAKAPEFQMTFSFWDECG